MSFSGRPVEGEKAEVEAEDEVERRESEAGPEAVAGDRKKEWSQE